ncbi:MAG: CDP-alcohol phosphatidyltransferase family protein, partial [Candidatus Omnitrophica bacterium]|nr:CDP-alcohol phosphatidyltransferase family protein [Candidatus Omnitrophota bacterium]
MSCEQTGGGLFDLPIYPIHFVICRIIVAGIIALLFKKEKASSYFIFIFLFGFATDVLDGIVARHYHSGSVLTAILDGVADFCLYTAALLYLKKFYFDCIQPYYSRLKMLVLGQLLAWGVCLIKFGHISSWHSYMAKIFGLSIISSMLAITIFR